MIWAFFLSISTILQWFLQALQVDVPHPLAIIFNNIRILSLIAITINVIEISFISYTNFIVLKRIPNYNHDFLAIFIQSANFFISIFLASVHSSADPTLTFFGYFGTIEDVKNGPKIRVFAFLIFLLVLQILVAFLHLLKEKISKMKCNTVHTISESVPPSPSPSPNMMPLNNVAFNADVVSKKIVIPMFLLLLTGIFFVYIPILYKAELSQWFQSLPQGKEAFASHTKLCQVLWTSFLDPLLFCTLNSKLRTFIFNSFCRRTE